MKRALSRAETATGDAADGGAKTIAEATYHRLRDDLTGLRFPPGEKLRFRALGETYGVGVSPLREALSRLASERLVTASGQRGFRVPPVSAAEMWEVIRLRQLLEREALEASIAQGDAAWESEVVAAFHRLTRADGLHDAGAWDRLHRDFHQALLAACGSPWLLHFIAILYHQSERYRRLRFNTADPKALPRDVDREHREIMEAALARKKRAAGELLVHHLARTGEAVARVLNSSPSPACGGTSGSGSLRQRALSRRQPDPTLPRKRGKEKK
jgi:DNA-binding GntR family transcriptional regulator